MGVEDFKNRLQSLIDMEPSVNAFAKKCECTEGALRSYLLGKSLPGLDKLVRIADAAGVPVQWLAIGEGKKPEKPVNGVAEKIGTILNSMDREAQQDVLKYAEKTKLLGELLAERQNKKAA